MGVQVLSAFLEDTDLPEARGSMGAFDQAAPLG